MYAWERVGVRVILHVERLWTDRITLTLALSRGTGRGDWLFLQLPGISHQAEGGIISTGALLSIIQ
jgi:hypothetical protein